MALRNLTNQQLIRHIRIRNIIIICLLLAGLLMYYIHTSLSIYSADFAQQMDGPTAILSVQKFRNWSNGKGVYYTPSQITTYLNTTFNTIKNEIDKPGTHPNHHYVVGFYWMKNRDPRDGKRKYDFCVIPTLVSNTDPNEVIDYFDDKSAPTANQKYNHIIDSRSDGPSTDNGHLWP